MTKIKSIRSSKPVTEIPEHAEIPGLTQASEPTAAPPAAPASPSCAACGRDEVKPATPLTETDALATARQSIINAAPGIVEALILKAQAGEYLPARMLFDFATLTAAAPAPESNTVSPIAARLLEQLEIVPSTM